MTYDAFYLVEPRPELVDHLRDRVDPDFADILLEPELYRRTESDRSMWFEASRLVQTKLLFMASLHEYDQVAQDSEFAALFGTAAISVELFDRWYTIRRFQIEEQLDKLENRFREYLDCVRPTGNLVVDLWLSELGGQNLPD